MYPYRLLVKLKLQKASVWRTFDELTYRQLCLIYFAVGERGDAPTNIRAGLNETEHRKAAETRVCGRQSILPKAFVVIMEYITCQLVLWYYHLLNTK